MKGKTINGYTLKERLGIGGMAEVWYAENIIGKNAAVKILLPELCKNEHLVERFLIEAKTMVLLDHPNIRQVYDYGSIDERPAIVMEYLDGDDLKARMKAGQKFTDEELEKWWNQLVEALKYTHEKGVIHRDIKPGNIFVDNKGDIKLLDFGIAKVRESISTTQTGQKLGTLMYMSPEQVKDSKNINYKSDIYSLAVTFVHLVTGKKPYNSDTNSDFEISEQIVYKSLDLSNLPEKWRRFLEPYLAKEAADRPELRLFEEVATAEEIEKEEATVFEEVKPEEKPVEEKKPVAEEKPVEEKKPKQPGKPKSKKGLWIVLGIVLVAAAVAAVFVLKPGDDSTDKKDEKKDSYAADTEYLETSKKQESTKKDEKKDSYAADTEYQYHENEEDIDEDTRTFRACKTLKDYQDYIKQFGRNANYYARAKRIIEDYDLEYYKSCNEVSDFMNYISIFGNDAIYYSEALNTINSYASPSYDQSSSKGSQSYSYGGNALSRGDWRESLNKCLEKGMDMSNGLFKGEIDRYNNVNGLGMMGWPTIGSYYLGEFMNDNWDGIGIYISDLVVTDIAGSCYFFGDWEDGYQTGFGACYDRNGNILYAGEFENGQPIDDYPMSSADLDQLKDYKFECIEYNNGDRYVGMTQKGKPHDYGFYLWSDGGLWYGHWVDGVREGEGIYIPYNGEVVKGVWHDNDME